MADFRAIEKKWQDKWYGEKTFEPSVDEKKKKFFFTVPYPYVSGALHVGHGRTYVNGDVIVRYKRMQGYNMLWPIAFHITGTPVLAVSAKIAEGNEQTVKLYEDYVGIYEDDKSKVSEIVATFKEPWNLVNYFSKKMVFDFKSMGFSLDLSRQFTTGDKEYNAFIAWQFHKYKDKNYLTQASYPLLYCINCKNAVGEDDIQDADTNPISKQEFIWGKFRLKNSDLILMAGTTRPDAFYGQTHLWIDPNATYKIIQVENEKWVVGSEAFEKIKYHYPQKNPKIVGEISARELMGKWVRGPLVDYNIYIVPGWFIDANTGSGIVYSALEDPVDLFELKKIHEDMNLIRQYNLDEKVIAKLKPISIINVPGMGENLGEEIGKEFGVKSPNDKKKIEAAKRELNKRVFRKGVMKSNCGACEGMTIPRAQEYLNNYLVSNNEAVMFYEPSREAYCRCGARVVVAVMEEQWFIDFNAGKWKEKAKQCFDKMVIYPTSYRKQFEDTFAWLDKRPAARRRGLGTQLPFANEWIIESLSDSTIYPAFYTIIKEIRNRKLKPEQLTLEFFDYIFLGKGKAEEIAKNIKAEKEDLEAVKKEFEQWYPCDQRHTAIAHISNHLSFYIFAHAAIFPEKFWPKAITVNELLICEGAKMSKSKGNVISLDDIRKNYFADLYRLYSTATADFSSVLDFRKSDVENSSKSFQRMYNALENAIELSKKKNGRQSSLTDWIISKFENTLKQSEKCIENFELRDYCQSAFYSMLNNWEYFNRRAGEEEKTFAAKHIAKKWILLLTPLMPHACEELNEKLGSAIYASLSKWPKVEEKLIKQEAEEKEEYIKNLVEDIRKVTQLIQKRNKKVTKCTLIVCTLEKWKELQNALKEEKIENVKVSDALRGHLEKHFYALKEQKPQKLDEFSTLQEAREFLEKDLEMQIEIEKEEESQNEKAQRAVPLKPSIALE